MALARPILPSVVVLDTETTGIDPSESRVIEYGAVRIRDGQLADRFQTLVNPGVSVPARITRITGLRTSDLVGAPDSAEALERLRGFVGADALVMHNAHFDRGFLDAEARRLQVPPIGSTDICSLRLARRVLPGLRSKGLARLASYFGVRNPRAHRALSDAETTAMVFMRLLERMAHRGLDISVDSLQTGQRRTYQGWEAVSPRIIQIRERELANAPQGSGVYYLKSAAGRVLYVGKARNLRTRLRTHFTAVAAKPGRHQQLLDLVRSVGWTETATDPEAILLESREIKRLRPRFNRAQLRYRRRPYLRILDDVVTFSAFVRADGAEYYGPLSDRAQAASMAGLLERAASAEVQWGSLRELEDPWLGMELPGVTRDALLSGRVDTLIEGLQHRMSDASGRLEFEEAGRLRDRITFLERLRTRGGLAAVFTGYELFLVEPRDRPAFWIALHGGLLGGTALHSQADAVQLEDLLTGALPDQRSEPESDEAHLIRRWTYRNRAVLRRYAGAPDESAADLAHRALLAESRSL